MFYHLMAINWMLNHDFHGGRWGDQPDAVQKGMPVQLWAPKIPVSFRKPTQSYQFRTGHTNFAQKLKFTFFSSLSFSKPEVAIEGRPVYFPGGCPKYPKKK